MSSVFTRRKPPSGAGRLTLVGKAGAGDDHESEASEYDELLAPDTLVDMAWRAYTRESRDRTGASFGYRRAPNQYTAGENSSEKAKDDLEAQRFTNELVAHLRDGLSFDEAYRLASSPFDDGAPEDAPVDLYGSASWESVFGGTSASAGENASRESGVVGPLSEPTPSTNVEETLSTPGHGTRDGGTMRDRFLAWLREHQPATRREIRESGILPAESADTHLNKLRLQGRIDHSECGWVVVNGRREVMVNPGAETDGRVRRAKISAALEISPKTIRELEALGCFANRKQVENDMMGMRRRGEAERTGSGAWKLTGKPVSHAISAEVEPKNPEPAAPTPAKVDAGNARGRGAREAPVPKPAKADWPTKAQKQAMLSEPIGAQTFGEPPAKKGEHGPAVDALLDARWDAIAAVGKASARVFRIDEAIKLLTE